MTERQTRCGYGLILLLGLLAFGSILAFHNITDGDLWGKLAIGASVWETGHLLRHDIFAFTPTLPKYIDHEWGAGFVFYGLLKTFGPSALMVLKILLACGALGFGILTGLKQGVTLTLLLVMAVPAAACLLPGYIPVLRSHAFTFCLFGVTLYSLEELRAGRKWPRVALPLVMLAWTNLHGGFVVGLAVVFFYAGVAGVWQKNRLVMAATAIACLLVTLVNPYGMDFWRYLIPALLHPRAQIAEWRPLPLWAHDQFMGFRLLFALTLMAGAFGWKKIRRHNLQGLAVLALTTAMSWRSRRHGPFFAVAALAFAGPYYAAVAENFSAEMRARFKPFQALAALYFAVLFFMVLPILPAASLHPLAPVGEDPVRETDILARAQVKGNLATPFAWGSYLTWRLYPNIRVSMDGRYETTYPESTFLQNAAFFDRTGDWFALCRDQPVDFVILDLATERLRPPDLIAKGYILIWTQENLSALLCLPKYAAALGEAARTLPPFTIDPLEIRNRPSSLFPGARPR